MLANDESTQVTLAKIAYANLKASIWDRSKEILHSNDRATPLQSARSMVLNAMEVECDLLI